MLVLFFLEISLTEKIYQQNIKPKWLNPNTKPKFPNVSPDWEQLQALKYSELSVCLVPWEGYGQSSLVKGIRPRHNSFLNTDHFVSTPEHSGSEDRHLNWWETFLEAQLLVFFETSLKILEKLHFSFNTGFMSNDCDTETRLHPSFCK